MSLTLSEHLPLITAAPDGIQKLRGLILELAVRGKLVPQDPTDEPASELLKEMAAERQQLESSGVYRKAKSLPAVTDKEIAFILPNAWSWVRLGQIGDWGAGATPSRSNSKYYGGGIPWFKSGELTADFISDSEERVTELALKECSLRKNQPGDVLIAMYGATIGKTAILSTSGTTNQAECACTPYSGLFNRYLLILLKALKPNFIGQGAGGAQPNISREKIVATVAALPPLEEQHRIVAKVDELMALCDRLESEQNDSATAHTQLVETLLGTLTQNADATDFEFNWKRIAEHFDTLFTAEASIDALQKTILQLAIMGKLVSQVDTDEPASELLKRIANRRTQLEEKGVCKKLKPPPPVGEKEKPFQTPGGWSWVRWVQIAQKIGDIDHKMPDTVNEGVPYVSPRDFFPDNRIDFEGAKKVSHDDFLKLSAKIRPEVGDIIYPRYGTIGENRLVEDDLEFLASYSCCVIKTFNGYVDPKYQFYFSISQCCRDQAKSAENKTTQANVGIKSIQEFAIPLPPLAEQHRIVAKVDELMAVCDSLQKQLAESRKQEGCLADTLIQASLKAS